MPDYRPVQTIFSQVCINFGPALQGVGGQEVGRGGEWGGMWQKFPGEDTGPPVALRWSAPIVPVMKADCQSVRICGDFKQTVNKAPPLDKYLFSQLAGGQKFTKLDMSQAYTSKFAWMTNLRSMLLLTIPRVFYSIIVCRSEFHQPLEFFRE